MKLNSNKSVSKLAQSSEQKIQKAGDDAFRSRRSSINSRPIQSPALIEQFNTIDSAKLQFKKLLEKTDNIKQSGIQLSARKNQMKSNDDNFLINSLVTQNNPSNGKEGVEQNGVKQKRSSQKVNGMDLNLQNFLGKSQNKVESNPTDILTTIIGGKNKGEEEPKNLENIIKSMIEVSGDLRKNENQTNGHEYFKDKMIKISSSNDRGEQHERKNSTSLWLGKVYDKCTSSAFKLYIGHDLDFNETKSYCCQQIISNLLDEIRKRKTNTQNFGLSRRQSELYLDDQIEKNQKKKIVYQTEPMKFINEESNKVLAYLCSKYPQTNVQGVNKQVAEIVQTVKIDNWANDQYDLLRLSGVRFVYKQSGDYSPQIMKFLNFLMQLPLKPHKKYPNLTNYKFFEQVMNKIFNVAFLKDTKDDISHILNQNGDINLENISKSSRTEQQEEYFEKIKKHTTILIGCKIPGTARNFTREDIQSGIIKVDENAISRVIDKWAQELGSKFFQAQNNILNRNYRFKSADNLKFYKVEKEARSDLFKILLNKKKEIQQFIKELKESLYDLSSKLALNTESDVSELKFISNTEKIFGEFAVKMSQSSSEYFIQILQKEINLLLESIEILKQRWLTKYKFKQSPLYEALNISLITFKIGDLFRCKIISNQNEIARVLKLFMILSEMWGNKLIKIIRVKNRLESGTRDVLINFMFDQICPCEVQLAVAEKFEQKQVYFDKFNHFLYEIKRAYLGPVMEMCKIWRQFQGKSETYVKTIQKSIKKRIKMKKISKELRDANPNEEVSVFQYKFPFICSSCHIFYPQTDIIYFTTLVKGKVYCGNCSKVKISIENQFGAETKKKFIFRKYISRYPNFYRVLKLLYELNTLNDMVAHKYQVHIPIYSKIIHMHFALMLKIQRNSTKNQEEYEYDQYAFVTTKMGDKGEIIKEVCSEKISRIEKSNSSLKSIMSADQASEVFNQNYIFYGWNAPTKLFPIPQSTNDHYTQLIQKFLPHLRSLQQQPQHKNLRICGLQVQPNKYYFLPLFIIAQQQISTQILKQNNLQYILKSVDKRQQVLQIENKEITTQWAELPINVRLKIAYTVKEIYLNNNNIREVGFIQQFHGLRVFQANSNLVERVPNIPVELEELSLQANRIQAINQFYFGGDMGNCQLKKLNLTDNPIKKIENISQISSLQNLFLMKCQIKKIEGLPTNLQILGMSMNQIQKIENLQNLKKLTKLSLVRNMITKIENLSGCKALLTLMLSGNHITTIQNLEELQNLSILHLSYTGLSSSNPERCMYYRGLKGLKNLRRLIVEGNKIECLLQMAGITEQEMQDKSYLNISFLQMRELSISENQIPYIDGIQKFMPYLEIVNISKNNISSIQNIQNLSLLAEFDASFNHIEQIPDRGWEKLFKLRKLDLSHNRIKVVPDLAPLLFLKNINFQSNRIVQINGFPNYPFGQPDFVRTIKLNQNRLFHSQTEHQSFLITQKSFRQLNPQSHISAINNGYSRQKLTAIRSIKQQLRLTNLLLPEMPLLTDNLQ